MTHGITYGYDAFGSVETFTTMLDTTCAEADRLWIAPLAEVGAYVKEKEATTLEISDDGKTLHITPRMSLDSGIFNQPLTLLINKAIIPAIASVKQDGKSLPVCETDSCYMLDFIPSAGMIVCEYE